MICDLLPLHQITSLPRPVRGGGIAVITSVGLKSIKNKGPSYVSFEYLDLNLKTGKVSFRLIAIYRPPPSVKNKLSFCQFIRDFSDLIERLFTSNNKRFLVGDFNIPLDSPSNPHTILFNEILTMFNLQQHVYGPTHQGGHTLDLVITRQIDCGYIASSKTFSDTLSDHSYIICELCFPSPVLPKINISTRKTKSIIIDNFKHDLQLKSFGSYGDQVDYLVDRYNSNLRAVLDSHAPLIHKQVTSRRN